MKNRIKTDLRLKDGSVLKGTFTPAMFRIIWRQIEQYVAMEDAGQSATQANSNRHIDCDTEANSKQHCQQSLLTRKRKIAGVFGQIIKQSLLTEEQKAAVKKRFDTASFLDYSDSELKEQLACWIKQNAGKQDILLENTHNIHTNKDINNTYLLESNRDIVSKDSSKTVNSSNSACGQNAVQASRQVKNAAVRFVPPLLEEVQAYCSERGSSVDYNKWYDYYSANGWMIGRNRMKDWRAAVRTWENNGYSNNFNGNKNEKKPDGRLAVGKKDYGKSAQQRECEEKYRKLFAERAAAA